MKVSLKPGTARLVFFISGNCRLSSLSPTLNGCVVSFIVSGQLSLQATLLYDLSPSDLHEFNNVLRIAETSNCSADPFWDYLSPSQPRIGTRVYIECNESYWLTQVYTPSNYYLLNASITAVCLQFEAQRRWSIASTPNIWETGGEYYLACGEWLDICCRNKIGKIPCAFLEQSGKSLCTAKDCVVKKRSVFSAHCFRFRMSGTIGKMKQISTGHNCYHN